MVGVRRMQNRSDTEHYEHNPDDHKCASHATNLSTKECGPIGPCSQTHPCATRARGIVRKAGKYYERAVAAAAATFFAALAAFAAVDALRRLLGFGGLARASPMSSGVIMLVTDSFCPSSSKTNEMH